MKRRSSTTLITVVVTLVVGIVSLRWSEKLPVNGGFGWDGVNYGAWAKDFHQSVFVQGLSDYYVQRVAPSGIVHYGGRALLRPFYSPQRSDHILKQDKNILLGFGIYNLLLLLLCVYVWGLIAANLNLSNNAHWFGFCSLFVNYAIAKGNFYTPMSTDTSGFALGFLMFYFFLARKPLGLLFVIVVGGFTWPTIPPTAALLLAFPRPRDGLTGADASISPSTARLSLVASIAACLVALLAFVYLFQQDLPRQWDKSSMVRINFTLLNFSVAAVIIYLFLSLRVALMDCRLFDFRYVLRAVQWKWASLGVLTLVLLRLVTHRLAVGVPINWTFREFVKYIFVSSLTDPFLFLVAHVIYCGPMVLLLIILWKPFCETVREFGIGMRLFVVLNVFLGICPQTRYQIAALPVFVAILVQYLDRLPLQRRSVFFWGVFSILYSKVWQTFNTAPMEPDGTMAKLQTFPLQNLFMNYGPWMSHSMYLIQGAIVLVTGLCLGFLVTKKPWRTDALVESTS